MEVEDVGGTDFLGGTHAIGGRRLGNHGTKFEYMFTLYLIFKLYVENAVNFQVASDHGGCGKFQDLHVSYSDPNSERETASEAIELKHSINVIREIDFTMRKRKFCLRDFFISFMTNRKILESCDQLIMATNQPFDESIADNFHQLERNRLLEEADIWGIRVDSGLWAHVEEASMEDLMTFSNKLRLATGLPEANNIQENILRGLSEMYRDRGYGDKVIWQLYLHIKDKFEEWYHDIPEYMTYNMVTEIFDKALGT